MVNTPGLQDDIEDFCDETFQNGDPSEAVKENNRNKDGALVVLFADCIYIYVQEEDYTSYEKDCRYI